MRVAVTGSAGPVMVGRLTRPGHNIMGVQTDLNPECQFSKGALSVLSIRPGVREVTVTALRGYDAVIHQIA